MPQYFSKDSYCHQHTNNLYATSIAICVCGHWPALVRHQHMKDFLSHNLSIMAVEKGVVVKVLE